MAGNCLTGKNNVMEQSRIKGKEAEKIAVEWLKKRGFTIHYWHKGKASNKPYDIIAEKGRERWAIDVKMGGKTV
jgi:predicted RecB family endonuclease